MTSGQKSAPSKEVTTFGEEGPETEVGQDRGADRASNNADPTLRKRVRLRRLFTTSAARSLQP